MVSIATNKMGFTLDAVCNQVLWPSTFLKCHSFGGHDGLFFAFFSWKHYAKHACTHVRLRQNDLCIHMFAYEEEGSPLLRVFCLWNHQMEWPRKG